MKGVYRFYLLLVIGEKRDVVLWWGLCLVVELFLLLDVRRSGGGMCLMKVKKWR